MPELRSCYFCGDPGESLGTYAVIPPRLDPTDEEQRTVVLCSTCQQKLVRVMEPLVERATASSARSQDVDAAAGPSAGESAPESTAAPGADATDEPGIQSSDRGITIPSTSTDDADADGSVVGDTDDSDDAGDSEPAGDVDADGADPDASAAATPNADDGSAERATAAAGRDAETVDQREKRDEALPGEYRKVMRLIENREFPMARTDLETVVTSAYGLEDDQCRRILDAAIERGVLVEDGAELRQP